MATEWTKQELLKAAQYMAAIPALDLLPGQRMSADEILAAAERGERGLGRVRLHLEHICQRNRALAALKRIYFICSNAGHAPCRYGGIDGEGNVCPNVCNCDWPKEIIPIVYAAIAACKKGDAR